MHLKIHLKNSKIGNSQKNGKCQHSFCPNQDEKKRVGEFERVSFDTFSKSMKLTFHSLYNDEKIREAYENVSLPVRATSGSAGYDIKTPIGFCLEPGREMTIPTGLRVHMKPGWFLCCAPRSGLGFKYKIQLNNTIGVIDEDYYFSDNEGHIFIKLTNDTRENRVLNVEVGDGVVQAIFIPYGITLTDSATNVRNGGFGSTDKRE